MPAPSSSTVGLSRGARSREDILDAAERLMSAHGYSATSMSTLARASGLPASSIYWHFSSKAGVLDAVLERGARRFLESATPPDLADRRQPLERLSCLVQYCIASGEQHRQFLRLFFALLLAADGEEFARRGALLELRTRSRTLLGHGFAWVYTEWGEQAAQRVAHRVTNMAEALFDGIFLAIEAGDDSTLLADQTVTALHALAESARGATPTTSAD